MVNFTADGATILMPGSYKILAIGPGGIGGTGGKSNYKNSSTGKEVYGAYGGGGGAAAYVYEGLLDVSSMGILSMVIGTLETKIFGSMGVSFNLILNQSGLSGSTVGGDSASVPIPGNSVMTGQIYQGTRGGGAGGTYGSRGTLTVPATTPGGLGDNANGSASSVPEITGPGDFRPGGLGASGGVNNPISDHVNMGGVGGRGANVNSLLVTPSTTATDIANKINGGSGGNGSAPAFRPAVTGMTGGTGGGGGGAWTSGSNGSQSGSPGRGVNGDGGNGGAGGIGCVWIIELNQQIVQKTR